MAAAARQAGVKTLVGYNYIRNPAVLHAKALIDRGAIGRVAGFRGVYDEDYMADEELPYSWRCRIADAGTHGRSFDGHALGRMSVVRRLC